MLLLLRFFTFFYVFFQNPKIRDFLRFFAVSRTFSRTMIDADTDHVAKFRGDRPKELGDPTAN